MQCGCVSIHTHVPVHAVPHVWRPWDNLWQKVVSFHHVDPRDCVRLGSNHPFPIIGTLIFLIALKTARIFCLDGLSTSFIIVSKNRVFLNTVKNVFKHKNSNTQIHCPLAAAMVSSQSGKLHRTTVGVRVKRACWCHHIDMWEGPKRLRRPRASPRAILVAYVRLGESGRADFVLPGWVTAFTGFKTKKAEFPNRPVAWIGYCRSTKRRNSAELCIRCHFVTVFCTF